MVPWNDQATPPTRALTPVVLIKHNKGDVRINPFGNRDDNGLGPLPHYHRRGDGEGQATGRHRPWETKNGDESFWSRC